MRPPEEVMSVDRAGAVMPNALSFPRATMRRLVRCRWKIEKLRFELDAEGRGEVLYRLCGSGWTFHFFLVSKKLAEEQKTDRNFAQSWDAMGVLCQGEWTAEREAYLRREVPKQRAGYADYDTLIYARGNRSARLFEHVVDSLASGRQPDAALLAPVGYILRTTAFIGNGQLGTRPLSGFGPDHPLGLPYHAQFCSAFMLREFVFDLVDHIARARNPAAERLDPAFRRYLGLGNSAATGLVAFVANHPHFMHRWASSYEGALAEVLRQPISDDVAARFGQVLAKAIRHFAESARQPDGIFGAPQDLSGELSRLQTAFADRRGHAGATPSWLGLREWCQHHLGREATELFNTIVLELYPEVVDGVDEALLADERFDLQPDATAAALLQSLTTAYGWALTAPLSREARYFWYRAAAAPRDVRRGVRGREPSLEVETCMDTARQVRALHACLRDTDGDTPVGEVAARHPELRHVIARVQSLAAMPYAELHEDWLAADFSPFAPIRFALSFFGLEKFEATPPKSVRGTFMQGAPIAEDVAAGRDGDWPFPLMPAAAQPDGQQLVRLPDAGTSPDREEAPSPRPEDRLRIAPGELARMAQTALQGQGAALGVAEEAARHVLWSVASGQATVADVIAELARVDVRFDSSAWTWPPRGVALAEFDTRQASALSLAPLALDFACTRARTAPHGMGAALVMRPAGGLFFEALAIRCAERGHVGLLLWHDAGRLPSNGWSLAGHGSDGPWHVATDLAAPPTLLASTLRSRVERIEGDAALTGLPALAGRQATGGWAEAIARAVVPAAGGPVNIEAAYLLVCIRLDDISTGDALATELQPLLARLRVASIRTTRQHWDEQGIALARAEFDALGDAGAGLLVAREDEPRVLDGVDPLKVF
jgi:hypothetical protein